MSEKEILRIDEAVKYTKDWLHFLRESGWETVDLNNYFGRKLDACLDLMIRYIEWQKERD